MRISDWSSDVCSSDLLGLDDVEPAFVDRYARADREDLDRDDERPEIQFAAIAERVIVIGGLLGAVLAVEQQHLVAAVYHRMHATIGRTPCRARWWQYV